MKRLPILLTLALLLAGSAGAQCPDWFIFDGEPDIGGPSPQFGNSVSGAGDVDNDGVNDIIVGAPGMNSSRGKVYIFSGSTGDTIRTFFTPSGPSYWLGYRVSGLGDINHDNYDDVIFYNGAGRMVVASGIDGSIIREYLSEYNYLGYAVPAGDVDNDGTVDIIVANPSYNCVVPFDPYPTVYGVGRVLVISGASEDTLYEWTGTCHTMEGLANLGASVAAAGDINHDGYDDIIVGEPGDNFDWTRPYYGSIYVLSGLNGDTLFTKMGTKVSQRFGSLVAAADVDNDGTNDIIVADGQTGIVDGGKLRVYSGRTQGLLYTLDTAGLVLAAVGDLNNDGRDDFATGSYNAGGNRGTIWIRSGVDGQLLDTRTGARLSRFGNSLAGVGDVNGDGNSDFVVGAYYSQLPEAPDNYTGRVHVITCLYQSPSCLADADGDGDGRGDLCDNCPDVANTDSWAYQTDSDQDGDGDACDECTDSDRDGYGNPGFAASICAEDNCPNNSNADQADGDGDGTGDVCDNCPDIANASQADPDHDGLGSECDNCPANSNPTQSDGDSDGTGDICDNCRDDANEDQSDRDNDGFGDVCDNCPDEPGYQADYDYDGIGNLCDECTDTDGDGYGIPNGFPAQTCDVDNCQNIYNPDQADVDADGIGDLCDICPDDYNPDQEDYNYDGVGDSCVTFVAVPEGYDVEVDLGEGVVITFEDAQYESSAEIFLSEDDPPAGNAFSFLPGMGSTVFNIDYYGWNPGTFTICIEYDDFGMDSTAEAAVGLFHHVELWDTANHVLVPVWLDVTSSLDTDSNIVCGETDDLSPFAVGIDGSCCEGRVGDINGIDGDEPSIGDVALLLDALFITANVNILPCYPEADVNQSGGADPAGEEISIGDAAILLDYLFITGVSLGLPDCM